MSWWQGRLVGFDLETTSPHPEEARIVTVAITQVGAGRTPENVSLLADPGVEIPIEASEIHGITTERARAEGAPGADVVLQTVDVLAGAALAGLPLVIFNARYDLTVLDREARRHGIPTLTDRLDGWPLRVIDPLVIDRWLDRFRKGSRKLEAICATYGAVHDQAHDADADALAACRAAWVLGAKGRVRRRVRRWNRAGDESELRALQEEWEMVRYDLDLLHEAQIRWAHDQAVSLADYFRRQCNPDADSVETAWPIVPVSEVAGAAA